jgi:hypothetical protein
MSLRWNSPSLTVLPAQQSRRGKTAVLAISRRRNPAADLVAHRQRIVGRQALEIYPDDGGIVVTGLDGVGDELIGDQAERGTA